VCSDTSRKQVSVAPFGILPSIIEEVACQRIQVAVRVRPLHDTEREDHCAVRCDSKRNEIVFGQQNKTMVFDWVAPPDTTQEEVFLRVGMPLANKCMEGYNGTAFAYGQTGSGKTFTMQGPCMFDAEFAVRGLIPRTLDYLFALIHKEKKMRPNTRITCQCSFYEIYNEDIFDLMQPTGSPPLTTRESSDKGPFVAGLLQHEIDNFDSAHAVLLEGTGRRRVGSTQMNRESSRSHSVFTLYLSQSINDDGFVTHKSCKLNFVDLAGSERQSRSAAEGSQLKEASSINKSLSTLGPVIRGLVEQSNGTNTHIPYRESKLTYLLRESFGGNSMTWMIANISPSRTSFGETLSTLQFAACAAQVVTRATVNEDIAGGVEELKHQIRSLQYRLDESEARVEALKDAQKRRRSVRLSVQPCIGGSPLAARTPTPHSHSTSVITASSSVTDQQVRSMISENSRMQRELQLARSHVHTLQAACKKKDERTRRCETHWTRWTRTTRTGSLTTVVDSFACSTPWPISQQTSQRPSTTTPRFGTHSRSGRPSPRHPAAFQHIRLPTDCPSCLLRVTCLCVSQTSTTNTTETNSNNSSTTTSSNCSSFENWWTSARARFANFPTRCCRWRPRCSVRTWRCSRPHTSWGWHSTHSTHTTTRLTPMPCKGNWTWQGTSGTGSVCGQRTLTSESTRHKHTCSS